MKNTKVIILAAGQGTRLRPLTDNIPKCMVKVNEKPILNWQLETLRSIGVENITVVTGYREDKIVESNVKKVLNKDFATTNMVYSLFCAEEFLTGEVLITYGDIIYSKEVLNKLMSNKNDIVIASDENWKEYWEERCENPLDDAESFHKDENGKVLSLGKKARSIEDINGQFIGLIKLNDRGCEIMKEVFHNCKEDQSCNLNAWNSSRSLRNAYMTDILNHIASNRELHYESIERGWFEVDNLEDLKIASRFSKDLE